MSRENPKEGYVTIVEKAVDYLITRYESGCRFRGTVAGIDFTLPDSNADANVVGCYVEVECKSFEDTVAATGGVDKIYYQGSIVSKVYLKHENDLVRLHCTEERVWLIVGFTGVPTLGDGSVLRTLSWDLVQVSVATALDWAHHGKTIASIAGGDPTVNITLPDLDNADGFQVRILQLSNDPKIICTAGDVFIQPNCALVAVDELVPESRGIPYTFIELYGIKSLGIWLIVGGSAVWMDDDDATARFVLGVVPGVSGNFVGFDANGQLKDSLSNAAGFATTTHEAEHLSTGGDVIKFAEEVFLSISLALDLGGGSPPAALETIADSPGMVQVRKFDDAAQEDTYFPWEVPRDIVAVDGIKVTVVGIITEATAPVANEGVVFKIEGYSVGTGDQLGGAFGTAKASKNANLAASGVDTQYDRFALAQSDVITVTDLAAGELAQLHLYRDVADAEDDYEQDVGIYGIKIQYNRNLKP